MNYKHIVRTVARSLLYFAMLSIVVGGAVGQNDKKKDKRVEKQRVQTQKQIKRNDSIMIKRQQNERRKIEKTRQIESKRIIVKRQQDNRITVTEKRRIDNASLQKRRINDQAKLENKRRIEADKLAKRRLDDQRKLDLKRKNDNRIGQLGPQKYKVFNRADQKRLQTNNFKLFQNNWRNWEKRDKARQLELERSRRHNHLRFHRGYWDRIRRDMLLLRRAAYYDNLIYNYRYRRGGAYYYTSQYGARMLQNALNNGYEEGYLAGQADRQDGWMFDYNSSDAYQDASYGYDGYYVDLAEYNYYFREGFRRGYEDGYYGRYQYGYYSGGKYALIGAIAGTILDVILY